MIEDIHKENLRLVKLHNIRPGTTLIHKDDKYPPETVEHIHKLYGWVTTDRFSTEDTNVPQEVSALLSQWDILN